MRWSHFETVTVAAGLAMLFALIVWLATLDTVPGQEARATWTDSTGKYHAVITVQDAGESVEDFLARHKAAIEAER